MAIIFCKKTVEVAIDHKVNGVDMKDKQLKQAFQQMGNDHIPDTVDIWSDLQEKVSIPPYNKSTKLLYSLNQKKWSLVTVTIILFFASVSYAFSSQIEVLLNQEPALNSALFNELGHIINLQQSHQGVDVTLEWAYADGNRASIIYTISQNAEGHYHLIENILTDSNGFEIPPFVGMTDVDLTLPSNSYLFSYDLSSYEEQTNPLQLQLSLILQSDQSEQLLEPFEFYFSIPVEGAYSMEINQQNLDKNISITLQSITITQTEVTSVICFESPNPDYQNWLPISQIDVHSDSQEWQALVGQQNRLENGCVSNRYFPTLYEAQGNWTLTVTELVGFREGRPLDEGAPRLLVCNETTENEYCEQQMRIAGIWAFEFNLDEQQK